MFQIKEKVKDVVDDVEDIAKTYYRLSVVNVVDKGSKLGSSVLIFAVVTGLAFFIFLFVGFAAAFWIGRVLGEPMLGFFAVAGFLLVILLLILALRKKVILPFIRNIIIKNFYD